MGLVRAITICKIALSFGNVKSGELLMIRIERLEPRLCMASDWQNSVVPWDVDTSGIVSPMDALLVINKLNSGMGLLGPKPSTASVCLVDVNGDNSLSPSDALAVINALDLLRNSNLNVDASLDADSDPNGNEVVLRPRVTYRGTTLPYTYVKVEPAVASNSLPTQTVLSDAEGKFEVTLSLRQPINHLVFTATDLRRRTKSTERVVRYGDVISDWNAELLEAVREAKTPSPVSADIFVKPPPPLVAKQLAMVHVAIFDAINAINPKYQNYALKVPIQTGASDIVAAATAAHRVAKALYVSPSNAAKWDLTLEESLRNIPDSFAKQRGIEVGVSAADAIIAKRANDGSDSTGSYTRQDLSGSWQPTTPDFSPPTLPQWPQVAPFVMNSGNDFRPKAPPKLDSAEYALAVDEVMELGSQDSYTRSEDQTEIARFWADGAGTSTPPGHWNSIAIDTLLNRNQSLLDRARTMALLNLALADAGIAAWDAKYAYDLWRPIDAIRKAGNDGNSITVADTGWRPLLNTPSFQSYVSGHSTFSSAAAEVLSSVFGTRVSFETRIDKGSSGVWPASPDVTGLAVRSYDNFRSAAEEAGVSRIYGGIHFNFDNTAGLAIGEAIGKLVVSNALKSLSR